MPIRDFNDAGGAAWQVWATTPTHGEVRPQFASGWLAFQCGGERRRLAPIPAEWTDVDDLRLCEFLAHATPLTRDAGAVPDAAGSEVADAPADVPALEVTVARVRAVIRAVDATLQGDLAG